MLVLPVVLSASLYPSTNSELACFSVLGTFSFLSSYDTLLIFAKKRFEVLRVRYGQAKGNGWA